MSYIVEGSEIMFVLNPFEDDNNPVTPEGYKLFIKAGERTKINKRNEVVSQTNCKAVLALMESLSSF